MHMKRRPFERGLYHALVTFPDVVYPFRVRIRGQWVRGRRAYDAALRKAFRLYGVGRYGYKLSFYRGFFHLFGSLAIIFAAAFVSQYFFGSEVALYLVLALTVLFISFQEFYLQRRIYRQLWKKGIVDWFTWTLPILVYVFPHIR